MASAGHRSSQASSIHRLGLLSVEGHIVLAGAGGRVVFSLRSSAYLLRTSNSL